MTIRNNRWTMSGLMLAIFASASNPAFAEIAQGVPAAQAISTQAEASSAVTRPDFSGVWELAKLEYVVIPEVSGLLTEEAKAQDALYKQRFNQVTDDPAKFCLVKGMPWTMLGRARNYPLEIHKTDSKLFMTFELYDQWRVIHLDGQAMPEGFPPSPNGWSVGHFDGDVLVIETTGLAGLNPVGLYHRSESAKITERWSLKNQDELGQVLEVDIIIDDPEVYAEPAKARQVLKRSPPGVVPGGYNCSSALWDDFVERRKVELKIK